jgi:hypothetical protein
MRQLILPLLLVAAAPALAGEWPSDLDAALAKAAKEKKPVVVDISSDG